MSNKIKEANKLLDYAEEILHYIVDSIKEKVPSKKERQAAFIDACKKEGLSSQEIVERASVFPSNEKSHVSKWPKL